VSVECSVIIVNYNTGDMIARCLDSLLVQQEINVEIIVVDNLSQDNSLEVLKGYQHQNKIFLITNQKNIGFGCANNQAEKIAQGKILFLLNPDCLLNDKLSLRQCIDYMDNHPEVGIAGTAIFEPRKNRWVKPQMNYPGFKKTKNTTLFQHLPGEIAWILGASMIIPKKIYQQLNGFDPDFFLYGEETDLCVRARKFGYQIAVINDVNVEHYSGASERQSSPKELYLKKQRGFYLFCRKHYDPKDVLHIAKNDLRRSQLKLFYLNLLSLIGFKNNEFKKERLRANIQAAKELIWD
jgi:GT2 family glycosyltransferase